MVLMRFVSVNFLLINFITDKLLILNIHKKKQAYAIQKQIYIYVNNCYMNTIQC